MVTKPVGGMDIDKLSGKGSNYQNPQCFVLLWGSALPALIHDH